ncbi:MAG: hypothetical protein ABIF08_01675 [Nanoarchaeota archaeon]
MIYLSLFWILVLMFIVVFLIGKIFKIKEIPNFYDNNGILFFLGLAALVIVAIVSRDPILGLNIPMELQWLGSLSVTLFGAWQFYLNPLKKRVNRMDREIGEIKSSVQAIRTDTHLIKEKIINGKIKK